MIVGSDGRKLMAAIAALRALRFSRRRIGVALVYHRVDERAGDPSLELNPAVSTAAFARQLRFFRRAFTLVHASELPAAALARRRGERLPLVIAFDDDLPGHARVVAPILHAEAAAATFFLCGSLSDAFFWWEDLQTAVDANALEPGDLGPLPPAEVEAALARRPRAIHRLAKRIEDLDVAQRRTLAGALAERARPLRTDTSRLTEKDVEDLASSFELGFHTLRHDLLPSLDDVELELRLTEGRDRLESIARNPIRAIAYPHGKADARVAAAARRAGFDCGYTGAHAAFTPAVDPFLIGRVEPRAGAGTGELAWSIAKLLVQA